MTAEELPESGENQEPAEQLAQEFGIQSHRGPGAQAGGQGAGSHGRQGDGPLKPPVFSVEQAGDQGGGQEEQQVDALRHPLLHG